MLILPVGGSFFLVARSSIGTKIKQFIKSVFREGLFSADEEFFINTAFAHTHPVYLANREFHGSGKIGKIVIFTISEFEDSRSYYHGLLNSGVKCPYYSNLIAICQVFR